MLAARFEAQTTFTGSSLNDRGWGPLNFKGLQAAAGEAALSRLHAGIRYRSRALFARVFGERAFDGASAQLNEILRLRLRINSVA